MHVCVCSCVCVSGVIYYNSPTSNTRERQNVSGNTPTGNAQRGAAAGVHAPSGGTLVK